MKLQASTRLTVARDEHLSLQLAGTLRVLSDTNPPSNGPRRLAIVRHDARRGRRRDKLLGRNYALVKSATGPLGCRGAGDIYLRLVSTSRGDCQLSTGAAPSTKTATRLQRAKDCRQHVRKMIQARKSVQTSVSSRSTTRGRAPRASIYLTPGSAPFRVGEVDHLDLGSNSSSALFLWTSPLTLTWSAALAVDFLSGRQGRCGAPVGVKLVIPDVAKASRPAIYTISMSRARSVGVKASFQPAGPEIKRRAKAP